MALTAVFVGINRHLDPAIPELSAARRDATALWALFTDTIAELATRLLVDEEATHTAVSAAILGTLVAAQEDDEIVISFAGHGSPDGSLVLFDTDATDLPSRQMRLTHIGGVDERYECNPTLRMYLDFIQNWFARDVGQGTEYLYNISIALKEAHPRGNADGWCYPSVAHRKGALNAALVPSRAADKLEVVAVIAAQTWRWKGVRRTDQYAVKFMEVGRIQSDGVIRYEPYDHSRHGELIPSYEPPDIAGILAGPAATR